MNFEHEILQLKTRLLELEDQLRKNRRSTEDALNNIDMDNLSSNVKKEIKAAGQNAEVSLIAEGLGEYDEDGNLIGISSAKIVAAVNDSDSSVKISADRIELDGITHVSDALLVGEGSGGEVRFVPGGSAVIGDDDGNIILYAANLTLFGEEGVSMNNRMIGTDLTIGSYYVPFEQKVVGSSCEMCILPERLNDGSHRLHFLMKDNLGGFRYTIPVEEVDYD